MGWLLLPLVKAEWAHVYCVNARICITCSGEVITPAGEEWKIQQQSRCAGGTGETKVDASAGRERACGVESLCLITKQWGNREAFSEPPHIYLFYFEVVRVHSKS